MGGITKELDPLRLAENALKEAKKGAQNAYDNIAKGVNDVTKTALKAQSDLAFTPIEWMSDALDHTSGLFASHTFVSRLFKSSANIAHYVSHTGEGASYKLAVSVMERDEDAFKEHMNEAFELTLLAASVATGNPYAIAATLLSLDTKASGGLVTNDIVGGVGEVETITFGTDTIERNRKEIVLGLGLSATIISQTYGMGMIMQGVNVPEWVKLIEGGKNLIEGINEYERQRKLYEQDKKRFERYLKWLESLKQQANNKQFGVFTNDKVDVYEYFAGGRFYQSGLAGQDDYTPAQISTPMQDVLGWVDFGEEMSLSRP